MLGFIFLCVCLLFGLGSWFLRRIPFGLGTNLQTTIGEQNRQTAQNENDLEPSIIEYQVFLSFRGPDSRQGLADILYSDMKTAGIRVFKDDDELDLGDEISKILPAIKSSKVCVPVFSKTFASSTWCLREVERMVELDKKIMPVFFTATPDDVKLCTELFKKDLKKHEKKYGREQVNKWKNALKTVARIKGREVMNTGYAEFSKLFVRALMIKLKVKLKFVSDSHVQRDDQEDAAMKLLDIDKHDVRLVGICGMGGIGKTTLAKVLFNRLSARFHCCSFLENVQESLQRDGLEYLQKQLVEDLDPKLKYFQKIDSMMTLKENFRRRKVLIVLDDVNERKQIEMIAGTLKWFDFGSRIIITTRDKRVLTRDAWSLEMREMNRNQALQLFSRCAFGEDSPPSDYQILSNEVLQLTGGLPLAVEVIGSLLYQCSLQRWKLTIEKLKKVPNPKIQEKLKISLDVLEYEQKQIFLDIACLFVNKERSSAIHMWEACDFFPDDGIEVLVSMSLVKMTKDNKFWVHNLIRDLGRRLVREECCTDPAKRSRIWLRKEALEVLNVEQGKENVEGLFLEEPSDSIFTREQFLSFRNLRILKLVGTRLAGDFSYLLPKLNWFSWRQCPLDFAVANLSLENLVFLDLSWSFISENWAGWNLIKMAKNLKVLDLTRCYNMTSTPDLSNNHSLERLILRGCRALVEMHSSISKLKRLKHLNLEECYSLKGLPELEDLEELLLDGNGCTFQLPESIGHLPSLSEIRLHRVEITRIPNSIGGLVNLTHLSLRYCTGMDKLPDALGDLNSLVKLDLSFTNISSLPNSIGQLVKLQSLCLQSTNIRELPTSVGDLKSLAKLDLRSSPLLVLPAFVGDMYELKWMGLDRCKIRELPSSIGRLTKLKILSAGSCNFLKEIPVEIGNLSALTELYLGEGIAELPCTVNQLSLLRALSITVHESSSAHTPISNSSFQWIGNLMNLNWLDFRHSSLTTLPFNLSGLTGLRSLQLCCPRVKCIAQLPSTLSKLELWYATADTALPDFSNLKYLSSVKFIHCSPKEEPKGLRALLMLKDMELVNCAKELVELSFQLENLRSLIISRPQSSGMLPDLSRLGKLLRLKLTDFDELAELRGLEKLQSLLNLTISNCSSLERVGNLLELKRLARINIRECSKLREVQGLDRLFSTYVNIDGCGFDADNGDTSIDKCGC